MQTWVSGVGGGGGEHLGKSPRPAAVIHPALVLRLRAGFYRRKRLPVSGFYPRKRGCLTQGSGRGLSPVPPPPPPGAAAARPTARRGGRTPSGLGAGGFVPLVGEGRGSDPAALRRYRFSRGEKKKKGKRKREWADHPKGTGGDGSPGPRGEGGLGSLPGAWRKAPGGSVGDAAGGRMAKGEWWKRHSPRFTFF